MTVSPLAGKPATPAMLVDVPALVTAYYTETPDPSVREQRVAFGTSGHRGSALDKTFNEQHVLAIAQAISLYRAQQRIDGPLFLGMDTHALSTPAGASAIEVMAANGVTLMIADGEAYTPTPAISHAILTYNRRRTTGLADGIVITPSHNPPRDGGFKYNPPHGGPAEPAVTRWIEAKANELLEAGLRGVKRIGYEKAMRASTTLRHDYVTAYTSDLVNVIDMDAIRGAGITLGVDPLGGAGVHYWGSIAERYGLNLTVVNEAVDPTFRFMTVDWDGQLRMDPSSPYAMQRLIDLKDRFRVAFACDPDHDRHGIVTRSAGLLAPNHYLSAAIFYLFQHRPAWRRDAAVGKTVVSSQMIDRVSAKLGRRLYEVPVGFKWFVSGLLDGSLGFAGEESAGASFVRRDGSVWTTDKDGMVAALLAAEITARMNRDPGEIYRDLTREFGEPVYDRVEAPATPEEKARLEKLSPEHIQTTDLAGERIQTILTSAPGDGNPIGGVKVVAESGWFAARPSGTEEIYKIYAESFRGADHLRRILEEAQSIVSDALAAAPGERLLGGGKPAMYEFDASISSAVEAGHRHRANETSTAEGPLSPALLGRMHRYWQAANYLTVGQIYLLENPLLVEPLRPEHIKPRLLGHWGTSPGLSFVYVHLNRLIAEQDVNMIVLAGPGHGGPAIIANVYLEGTYSEVYPEVTQTTAGLRRLFRQFSTPGGVPSHVSAPTPGSIHEGGELGYVLSHAFGAAFDNPDLIVAAVVGDGEAETGPLAGSWQSVSFLNPARDGAVLPILHLNGYKIGGPTVLARSTDEDVRATIEGHGYDVHFVEGDDPVSLHQQFAATLDRCHRRIRAIQSEARETGVTERPRWPAIVLRTPKGWTGPREVDGLPVEGTFRSHQVPLHLVRSDAGQLAALEAWMRSYHPDTLFDANGQFTADLAALAPKGRLRMGANPHANGGTLLVDLRLPDFSDFALPVAQPASTRHESTRPLGKMMRDIYASNAGSANFRLFCPDETASNRLDDVFAVENRCFVGTTIGLDDHVTPDGRVMEVLSEHLSEGWLEGYLLTGRHGLFASYEAFAMIPASMVVQHAKWLAESARLPWRAPIASLNVLLTSTCWRNDHNGFSHQGPGLIDVMLSKRGTVARIYLPPDANCLLSVADHAFRSRNYVNLIVIDKQPQLQWLDLAAAKAHCARGASVWRWASSDDGGEPDVVLAAAGDVPTLETTAAAWWLRRHAPELRVRVVNVVDLMTLFPQDAHPHGMTRERFVELFTEDKPVVFAFHGYQRAIHEIVHGRPAAERFHVRGFKEQGTTTTPFDMVALNGMSRYHLCIEALRRTSRMGDRAAALTADCRAAIEHAAAHAGAHFEDPPEIRDWVWST